MSQESLCFSSLAELAERIRKRERSPVDVVEAHLQRIEALNPRILAFLTVTADEARRTAKAVAAELAAGRYHGPLQGIPWGAALLPEGPRWLRPRRARAAGARAGDAPRRLRAGASGARAAAPRGRRPLPARGCDRLTDHAHGGGARRHAHGPPERPGRVLPLAPPALPHAPQPHRPAIAVPMGFSTDGLPLSLQIVGRPWGEADLLGIAHAYETATPELRGRRPPGP